MQLLYTPIDETASNHVHLLCTATFGGIFGTILPSKEDSAQAMEYLVSFTNLATGRQINIRFNDEVAAICAFTAWLRYCEDPAEIAERTASWPEVIVPPDLDCPD